MIADGQVKDGHPPMVVSKEEVDGVAGSEDDVDVAQETQLEKFVSGLIVTPPSDVVPSSRKKRVLRSVRRSLAREFEEDVDEALAKKSRRIAALLQRMMKRMLLKVLLGGLSLLFSRMIEDGVDEVSVRSHVVLCLSCCRTIGQII